MSVRVKPAQDNAKERIYTFRVKTEQECAEWVTAVNKAISGEWEAHREVSRTDEFPAAGEDPQVWCCGLMYSQPMR